MNGGRELSSFQGKDAHLLGVEHLSLFDPFCDSGGDREHGEDHSGKLLVKSWGELVDEGDVVGDTCFRSKVLEIGDVFLESIVHDAVRAFEQFLSELGELEAGGCLGVIGEERRFEV